jgi:hypothetical protein
VQRLDTLMAGADPDFDAEAFQDAIAGAMVMGTPNQVEERVVFHFASEITQNAKVDDVRQPWVFNVAPDPQPEDTTPEPVADLTCIVDWGTDAGATDETRLGPLRNSRAQLIVLKRQWDVVVRDDPLITIADFTHVVIGGDVFVRGEHVAVGLHDVDVHFVELLGSGSR